MRPFFSFFGGETFFLRRWNLFFLVVKLFCGETWSRAASRWLWAAEMDIGHGSMSILTSSREACLAVSSSVTMKSNASHIPLEFFRSCSGRSRWPSKSVNLSLSPQIPLWHWDYPSPPWQSSQPRGFPVPCLEVGRRLVRFSNGLENCVGWRAWLVTRGWLVVFRGIKTMSSHALSITKKCTLVHNDEGCLD